MTALDLIRSSNQWDYPWSVAAVVYFCRRYPWTVAFLILALAMCIGFYRVDAIADQRQDDLADRRADNLTRDRQFCAAIPNAAESGAQALVNIIVQNDLSQGEPPETIAETRALGVLYTAEARRLVLEDLPECQKILEGP